MGSGAGLGSRKAVVRTSCWNSPTVAAWVGGAPQAPALAAATAVAVHSRRDDCPRPASRPDGVLCGTRVVSLALNLPGPAALMRLAEMGATCLKVEPPARDGAPGDPMAVYAPAADEAMHRGIARHVLDLTSDQGRPALHTLLQEADVLVTSFRPSALWRRGASPTSRWRPMMSGMSSNAVTNGPSETGRVATRRSSAVVGGGMMCEYTARRERMAARARPASSGERYAPTGSCWHAAPRRSPSPARRPH